MATASQTAESQVRWLQYDNEADWLAARFAGIGASEAAAVLGISPWLTPLELFLRKTGQIEAKPATPRMQWGNKLEALVAEDYASESGLALEKPPSICYLNRAPWMRASLDYWVPGDRVVEIKTVTPYGKDGFGEDGSDEIPEHYQLQVQQQMSCSGLERADLVALYLGSYTMHVFHLVRNQDVIDKLEDAEYEFMDRVKRRDMPLPDFNNPATADILSLLEPLPDSVVLLGDAESLLADEYKLLGEQVKELEERRKKAKALLLHSLGQASEGDLPDGRTIRRKLIEKGEYVVKPSSYYDFRILNPKKRK